MIICTGIGPGHRQYLTALGQQLISEADVVAGFGTVLDLVAPSSERTPCESA
ncbi:hypothetical protein [Deinococcus ruber]|uniref:hypothetical protein n=1 Tax=Deinococcus ruber TaxID=1848197 RepID=UPI001E5D5F37|nr:hypothetical protein [Deinococcus ruber]